MSTNFVYCKTDVLLNCASCKKKFYYSKKEFNRQSKKGRSDFFCTKSCVMSWNNKNRTEVTRKKMSENLSIRNRGNTFNKKGNFTYYLNKSKSRGWDNDLDDDYLNTLWNDQNSMCSLSGIQIHLKRGKHVLNTASLDRIDSSKGYVKGNVQFVAYALNLAKNNFSDSDVRELIESIRSVNSLS